MRNRKPWFGIKVRYVNRTFFRGWVKTFPGIYWTFHFFNTMVLGRSHSACTAAQLSLFPSEAKLIFEYELHRVREYPPLHSQLQLRASRMHSPSGRTVHFTKVYVRGKTINAYAVSFNLILRTQLGTPLNDAGLYLLKHGPVQSSW